MWTTIFLKEMCKNSGGAIWRKFVYQTYLIFLDTKEKEKWTVYTHTLRK